MEWIFSNGAPPVLYMPAGSYKTKNGYIMVSAMRPHHFKLLFELIGRHDIANDPELQSHEARIRNAPKIIKALQEAMPSKTPRGMDRDPAAQGRVLRAGQQLHGLSRAPAREQDRARSTGSDQERVDRLPVANIAGLPRASEHPAQQHAPHIGEDGPGHPGRARLQRRRSRRRSSPAAASAARPSTPESEGRGVELIGPRHSVAQSVAHVNAHVHERHWGGAVQ